MPCARRPGSARRRERGGVALLTAVATTLLLLFAALAVDLGMQRVVRRDMQALADVVAMDLARELVDDLTQAQLAAAIDPDDPSSALSQSVARNDDTLGEDLEVTADWGSWVGGVWDTAAEPPTAVRVQAGAAVEFGFVPGSGGASRSAVGVSEPNVCFRLGSFAAALNSSNSPLLNAIIGDALDVTAVSYTGLANSTIELGDLALELGAASAAELVALPAVRVSDLVLATAEVLRREPGADLVDVGVLESIATKVSGDAVVRISELIELSTANDSALATRFNVLDLVAGGAMVANGESLLDFPVTWNVPQFSQGEVYLKVLEQPKAACGGPGVQAQTAQLQFLAVPKMNVPNVIPGLTATGSFRLEVDLAGAQGTLRSAQCGAGTATDPDSTVVDVDRAVVSTVNLQVPIRLTGTIDAAKIVGDISLLGLGSLLTSLLGVTAEVDIVVQAGLSTNLNSVTGSESVTYAVPPMDYVRAVTTVGSTALVPTIVLDPSRVSGTVTVKGKLLDAALPSVRAGLDLSAVLDALVQKQVVRGINDYIANANSFLLPLLNAFGVNVAGADLLVLPRPICNFPVLRD